jgi:CDP-diacylglycerol--glycerol-3-phosphate 3-phosphatidyltransferase
VRSDADANPTCPQLVHLVEVRLRRFLPKPIEPAARVRREEKDNVELGFRGRVDCGKCLVEPEVVELADSGVAGSTQLAVDERILASHAVGRMARSLGEHLVAPRPEVAAARTPTKCALERVAVSVDETGKTKRLGHCGQSSQFRHPRAQVSPVSSIPRVAGFSPPSSGWGCAGAWPIPRWPKGPFSRGDYPFPMSARAVPLPLQQLPNALTVFRLLLIPVFVALMLAADGGHSWPAGIVFGVAGVTDQIDGFLARRWHVESHFGRIADPLADRLMIDAAVILLFIADHMPWPGLVVVLGRDLALLLGYKFVAPEGYELHVNLIGKAATWVLYAGIGFLIVTHRSTHWPYWVFTAGLVLAVLAAGAYALTVWRGTTR